MNVNLGAPYNLIIQRLIGKGYAGSKTEVIRQALLAYERNIEYEEVMLVNKGVEAEMALVKSGKSKLIPFAKVKAKYKK